MNEFLIVFRMDITTPEAQPTPEQMEVYMRDWMVWIRGISARGQLVEGGNHLSPDGWVIKPRKSTTHGPYVANGESVSGYILIVAEDDQDAIAIASACPILMGEGTSVEIRKTATPTIMREVPRVQQRTAAILQGAERAQDSVSEGHMADPVVHFEIIGKDAPRLRTYYENLFGWKAETDPAVAREVPAPGNYGFIGRIPTNGGAGIPGGIGGGREYDTHTVFYVGVPNVRAALLRAETLGGKAVMGPVEKPGGGLVVAHFRDPEGNLIGLAGPK